ncbi:MAG: hypothetical protein ACRDHY_13445 [Anaerolineales bacterium]
MTGGRGHLYRAGLDASHHPLVAFTDSATIVGDGWRNAAAQALEAGASVVGGPVRPRGDRSWFGWAGFLAEYGVHSVPPFASVTGDVAANNVAYRRSTLDDVLEAGQPVWKSAVNAHLRKCGGGPTIIEAMEAVSAKRYGWHDLVGARFAHGRHYAGERAMDWSRRTRLVAALGCAGLPAVGWARLLRRVGRTHGWRFRFAVATPLLMTALAAWSMGEAVGYLVGGGEPGVVF